MKHQYLPHPSGCKQRFSEIGEQGDLRKLLRETYRIYLNRNRPSISLDLNLSQLLLDSIKMLIGLERYFIMEGVKKDLNVTNFKSLN